MLQMVALEHLTSSQARLQPGPYYVNYRLYTLEHPLEHSLEHPVKHPLEHALVHALEHPLENSHKQILQHTLEQV